MKARYIKSRCNLTYNTVAKKIVDAKNKEYKNIDFYGGEPTCFSFLKKAIKLANNLGMSVTLATNAVKFSSNEYTDRFFPGVNIKGIRTSLHDYKPEVHDTITQIKGSFDKTIKGIENILRYNKRFSVNVVINALNYKDIVSMPDYIYKLGVKGIKFSGLILYDRILMNRWLTINISSFLPYLFEALEKARKLGFTYIEVEKLPRKIFKNKKLKFVHFLD
jgi:MoaA/NifB/PqqE/SkfB family radical SAM enzyme